MTYLSSTRIPGASIEGHHDLLAALPTSDIDGLLARYAGVDRDMLVITAVWSSKVHYDRFATELLAPVACALPRGPGRPETVEYEVAEQFVAARPVTMR